MNIEHNMQREASTSTIPVPLFHCGRVGLQAGTTHHSVLCHPRKRNGYSVDLGQEGWWCGSKRSKLGRIVTSNSQSQCIEETKLQTQRLFQASLVKSILNATTSNLEILLLKLISVAFQITSGNIPPNVKGSPESLKRYA